ncbi:carboxymuconolactone decarboxylase family protein [Antrihabitans spumae]|jgi:AhpD family alkylhydroperoxidase|uniref:Carboxymuconolactone decarboxylase family protein n=1 Tax=Antrihabitans spumae TaxID=3373370 RepID=A0ABW7JXK2_9NOCA
MSSPRIQPGRFKELGPINWVLWRVISKGAGATDAHLFSTLGRTGGLFRGWLHYSGKLMPGGKLTRFESELVIIRIAHLRECGYEMDHHVRLGRRAGVTAEILEQVLEGPTAEGLAAKDRALLSAVDSLVQTKALDDATWSELSKYFDDRRLIEICLLVTQYDGLATTIGVLQIDRDFQ